jgi:hypothetical protein
MKILSKEEHVQVILGIATTLFFSYFLIIVKKRSAIPQMLDAIIGDTAN